jgi:UDP-3-O-[3-hydroxymyristoyl] glucosamine N-acyltransferase
MYLDSPPVLDLQDARKYVSFEVAANGEFSTLGFLIDSLDRMLTFVEHSRYLPKLRSHKYVSAVITTPQIASSLKGNIGIAVSANPRHAFFLLHNALAATDFYSIRTPSRVDASARIHPRASISETEVEIGPEVVIEANAVIGRGCKLARGVKVHAGAVLGGAGFQTLRGDEEYVEMVHAGGVAIDEGAIIFSNATVAKGLFRQSTRIGAAARIGNNAFVSHNAEIGARSFIGHGAVVNGNTHIGRECWIGPGAVLSNGVTLGDKTQVSLGSVVVHDISAGEHVSGNFAVGHERFLRHVAQIR